MADPDHDERDAEVAALRAEVTRLNKVVDALMDRVEADTNVQVSDFGLFQTTIMLQDQVRVHTQELEAALRGQEREEDDARDSARDVQTLRRTAALQIQLLELVVQQKDVGELVERVAGILDIPIVLYDAGGEVVAASRSATASPGLATRLWARYSDRGADSGPDGTAPAASERVFFRDVLVMDRVERVLAAVTTQQRPSELAGASLLFLQQLVTLDLLRSRDEQRMRRRLRRGLLQDIVGGEATPEDLRVRLQAQGFDDEAVLRLAIVELVEPRPERSGADGREPPPTESLHAIDAALGARREPYLTAALGSRVMILTAVPDAEPATARTLLADVRVAAVPEAGPDAVAAGCSAAFTGVAGATRALQQARAACMAARRMPHLDGVGVFEELGGLFRLMDGLDKANLRRIVRRTFGPVLDYDAQQRTRLFETLRAYFERGLAVQETADALHVHRNTLQKRLAHVEELLAVDLADVDVIVDVRLGLHAAELLDDPRV